MGLATALAFSIGISSGRLSPGGAVTGDPGGQSSQGINSGNPVLSFENAETISAMLKPHELLTSMATAQKSPLPAGHSQSSAGSGWPVLSFENPAKTSTS